MQSASFTVFPLAAELLFTSIVIRSWISDRDGFFQRIRAHSTKQSRVTNASIAAYWISLLDKGLRFHPLSVIALSKFALIDSLPYSYFTKNAVIAFNDSFFIPILFARPSKYATFGIFSQHFMRWKLPSSPLSTPTIANAGNPPSPKTHVRSFGSQTNTKTAHRPLLDSLLSPTKPRPRSTPSLPRRSESNARCCLPSAARTTRSPTPEPSLRAFPPPPAAEIPPCRWRTRGYPRGADSTRGPAGSTRRVSPVCPAVKRKTGDKTGLEGDWIGSKS